LAAQRSIADAPFYQINPSAVFQSFRAGGRALPLAADRTTHVALQASQGRIPAQVIRGLIAGDFGPEVEPGLYMLWPYASGKVPVLFVHGLASSPLAFLQAIKDFQPNDLVVPLWSARLDGAASEAILPGNHGSK